MTERSDTGTRVLIAVTEFSPVDKLWRAALDIIAESPGELLAVFVSEDHWHRAASLPFTLEISRLSGAGAKFTQQRAEQVRREAIQRTRALMTQLAANANLALAFEVLAGSDTTRFLKLATGPRSVLVVPSILARRPLYAELKKTNCRIELVGYNGEPDKQQNSPDPVRPR